MFRFQVEYNSFIAYVLHTLAGRMRRFSRLVIPFERGSAAGEGKHEKC